MNWRQITFATFTASALFLTACKEEATDKPAEMPAEKPVVKVEPKPAKPAETTQKASDSSINFELKITNGHLGKVILGLNEKATDGYDKGLDDMAPPPGMETGYTALVAPDNSGYFYRDTRKPAEEIDWTFYSKVYKGKPVKLEWDTNKIPAGYKFEITWKEKVIDMAKTNSVTISEEDAFVITATAEK